MIPIKPSQVRFTDEQWKAIHISGKNIIVSAGAGSGKTSVLTERVIQKIISGHKITSLLVLTFTNAAASEMRTRIRQRLQEQLKISASSNIIEALEYLDIAHITTFDSYCLFIVKKYSHLLNISKDIQIGDKVILEIAKKKIINNLFDDYFQANDPSFINYLKTYTTKSTTLLENQIIQINHYMSKNNLSSDYMKTYFDHYYTTSFFDQIEKDVVFELNILNQSLSFIISELNLVETTSEKGEDCKINWISELQPITTLQTYDQYYNYMNTQYSNLKLIRNLDPNEKSNLTTLRDSVDQIVKTMKTILSETKETYEHHIHLTKEHVQFLLDITLKFNHLYRSYQHEHHIYDFSTIASLATKMISNYSIARNHLKNVYHEIFIDEYQDTSYLQNELISYISNDNVFMVGDIKQSIYRFRDAVPQIFQSNYISYSKDPDKGHKVDLNANFRSRYEVISDINALFMSTMDQTVGGINYDNTQQLVFKNHTYQTHKSDVQSYGITILKNLDESIKSAHLEHLESIHAYPQKLSTEAIHAQIIVQDIKQKLSKNEQVYDNDLKRLRPAKYDDFVILIDRSTSFDLFKQIFEYHGLPLHIHKEQSFIDNDDILAIRSMLKLVMALTSIDLAKSLFKHALMSFGRSFILNIADDILIDALLNIPKHVDSINDFMNISDDQQLSDLLHKMKVLADDVQNLSIDQLLIKLINEFEVIDKAMSLSNVYMVESRILYLIDKTKALSEMGYHLSDLLDYFDYIAENDLDLDFSQATKLEKNAVNIMTIHKSKGLEFPIVYFPLLYKKWQKSKSQDIYCDQNYGLIISAFKEGLIDVLPKYLIHQKENREMISERLRLFYVALTRAKENAILIINEENEKTYINPEKSDTLVDTHMRQQFTSFEDVIYASIGNINHNLKLVNFDRVYFNTNYLIPKRDDVTIEKTSSKSIVYKDLSLTFSPIKKRSYSHINQKLTTKKEHADIGLGDKLHKILENIDYKKDIEHQLSLYCNNDPLCLQLKNIKNLPIFDHIETANIYKEHTFLDPLNNTEQLGIIDLLIVFDSIVYIVDYKLQYIDHSYYINQIEGYKSYIQNMLPNHEIRAFIYSLISGTYKEIKN